MKTPLLIISPMDAETDVLLNELTNKKERPVNGRSFFSGTLSGRPVVLVRSYIGAVNAVMALRDGVEAFGCRAVITQGTSGAHRADCRVGDIIVCERVCFGDSIRTARTARIAPSRWEALPTQALAADGTMREITHFECDRRIVAAALALKFDGRVFPGVSSSTGAWNREKERIARDVSLFGGDVEEMEDAFAAQAALGMGVAHAALRVVSNNELAPRENYDVTASHILQRFIIELLRSGGLDCLMQ